MARAIRRAVRGMELPVLSLLGGCWSGRLPARKATAYVTSWLPLILAPPVQPMGGTGVRLGGKRRHSRPVRRWLVSPGPAERDPSVPKQRVQRFQVALL